MGTPKIRKKGLSLEPEKDIKQRKRRSKTNIKTRHRKEKRKKAKTIILDFDPLKNLRNNRYNRGPLNREYTKRLVKDLMSAST
jgi:hypothetical protein